MIFKGQEPMTVARMERSVRLGTGLIMATFLTLHLLNLALGAVSIEAMEAMRHVLIAVWNSLPGMAVLLGSMILHVSLALVSLYRRGHLRLAAWEWVQLLLGLSIPLLAALHVVGTRITIITLGMDISYPYVLAALYGKGAFIIFRQGLLVVAAWGHMAVGIHFWLRTKAWYPRAVPVLYPASILVPVLALVGYGRSMADVADKAAEPGWVKSLFAERAAAPADLDAVLSNLDTVALSIFAGLLILVLVARRIRQAVRNRLGTFTVTYASGEEAVMPLGMSVLDASRVKGIAHASVCGGRGRCSTCRVRIGEGFHDLPPPEADETAILERIGAMPSVRLACQTRPRRDVSLALLLPPGVGSEAARRPGGLSGREMRVAILFVDLRGSTLLGERNLPYDVIFLLNDFFAEMSRALEVTGGHYAQFNGDGLMAIYGLETDFEAGARQSVAGASEMFRRLRRLNRRFAQELGEPLAIGVGIHGGEAIVGSMGPPSSPIVSAIGDNVNIAARLESETKTLGYPLIVSQEVAMAAGLRPEDHAMATVSLRGRTASVAVIGVEKPEALDMI